MEHILCQTLAQRVHAHVFSQPMHILGSNFIQRALKRKSIKFTFSLSKLPMWDKSSILLFHSYNLPKIYKILD